MALMIIIVESSIIIIILILMNTFRNWVIKTLEKRVKNKYNAIINNLEQKYEAAKSAYNDYRNAYENLRKKEFEIDTEIKGLIDSIDSFENESKDNKENLSVLMEKDTLIRIVNPSDILKVTNDTNKEVLVTIKKLEYNTTRQTEKDSQIIMDKILEINND